jgi:hypothetical protein
MSSTLASSSTSSHSNSNSNNDLFTIKLRGEPLTISRAQIESDSPGSNLFASSLLGDFAEASNHSLTLDRHPGIFKLILDHLSGYRILPLDEEVLKNINNSGHGMSENRCLRYLQDDSEYYGFERLHSLIDEEIDRLESREDDLLDIKKQRLQVEVEKLELNKKNSEERTKQISFERKLAVLRTNLQVLTGELQASATWAASRQVGGSSYGVRYATLSKAFRQKVVRADSVFVEFLSPSSVLRRRRSSVSSLCSGSCSNSKKRPQINNKHMTWPLHLA